MSLILLDGIVKLCKWWCADVEQSNAAAKRPIKRALRSPSQALQVEFQWEQALSLPALRDKSNEVLSRQLWWQCAHRGDDFAAWTDGGSVCASSSASQSCISRRRDDARRRHAQFVYCSIGARCLCLLETNTRALRLGNLALLYLRSKHGNSPTRAVLYHCRLDWITIYRLYNKAKQQQEHDSTQYSLEYSIELRNERG